MQGTHSSKSLGKLGDVVWRVVTEMRTGEAGEYMEEEGLAIGTWRVTGPVMEEAGCGVSFTLKYSLSF